MKKTQYLAGIVAVSMMLMGAGYAAWTQSVTVTHQTELGELRVDFGATADQSADYVSAPTVTKTDNVVAVKLGNFYPGAQQGYNVTFKNTGTIGAKFSLAINRTLEGQVSGTTALTTQMYSIDGGTFMDEEAFINEMNKLTNVAPNDQYNVKVISTCNDFNNGDNEKAKETITYTLNVSQFNK